MKNPHVITLVLTAAIGLVACKKQATEEPVAEAPATQNEPPPEALAEAEKADVHVDDEVMKLCDMPAPNFKFNSAKLAGDAKSSLEILAECFISGKAKDKRMALIGHTDPRGEDDYNLALGQRRADSVAKYLSKKGLPNNRMDVTSRGEMDATGSDDAGWSADRRVDIRLASN